MAFLMMLASTTTKNNVLAVPTPHSVKSVTTTTPRGGAAVKINKKVITAPKKAVTAPKKVPTAVKSSSGGGLTFPTEAVVGSIAMALVERVVKQVFIANGISFPAQLAGCIVLFFALLLADAIIPGSGKAVYEALGPGTTLLTKWLPVFFVPGLAMLPLAPSVGSGIEVRPGNQ
jgi:hypothetical protein